MANSTLENPLESLTLRSDVDAATDSSGSNSEPQRPDKRLLESVRLHYHSDHQVEYLQLQAQIESLLVQLQEANH